MQRFGVELRAEMDGNTLRGHAAVFGAAVRLPGHYEQIAPTAFSRALSDPKTDVRALMNHNPSALLGRQSSGTLRVGTDDVGLTFEVDLPDTSYARDLRNLVERGDLTGASFGFVPGEDEWAGDVRTHTSVRSLLDVSPATFPAYGETDVSLRHHVFPTLSVGCQLVRARHSVHMQGKGI